MSCSSSSDEEICKDSKHTKFSYFGPRLVPFLKTACFYLIFVPEINPPNIVVAIFKCLPMLSLCIFVLWFDGFSFASRHQYSRRILAGLVLSTLGDFCLVWADEGYFIHGVASFAVAHVMYIFAFGFNPLRPLIYMVLSVGGIFIYWYIYAGLTDSVLKVSVLFYMLVIVIMNWRALARIRNLRDIKAGVTSKNHTKWTHLVACMGSIMFFISDSFLAINRFHSPVTHQRWIVMTTYYLAQLGIALSVIKGHNVVKSQKTKRRTKSQIIAKSCSANAQNSCYEAVNGSQVNRSKSEEVLASLEKNKTD